MGRVCYRASVTHQYQPIEIKYLCENIYTFIWHKTHDRDLLVACDRLKVRHPDALTWIGRVGYDAVFAIGGTLAEMSEIKAARQEYQAGEYITFDRYLAQRENRST